MAKCAADECEQLCANDYPLCEKCSPLCSAPFCTQRMVSTADNMCSECGGAFEAQITVTNAHVCTYEMLVALLEGRMSFAKKAKAKKIAAKEKVVLKRCLRKVGSREAKALAKEYADRLAKRPIEFFAEIRGCALTKVNQVQNMWNVFFASKGGDDGLYIQPFVGSAKNNNAFLFFIGCATCPNKDASIAYSNYYDPMCLTALNKEEVEAFNGLAYPSALFLQFSQFSHAGAAAKACADIAKGAAVEEPKAETAALWSDDDVSLDGPDTKRAKVSE